MARWQEYRMCPGCGWDIGADEGDRGCSYGDCPYLPEALDVFCPQCRFNFASMTGNPPCEDPESCEHGAEARSHVENYRAWAAAQPVRH